MGKTGTVQWVQVKGVKGQIRLVPRAEGELKRAGPNQRFKAGASLRKLDEASGDGRGFRRGGRGGGAPAANPMVRHRMRRAKSTVMGAKQKSSR